MTTEGSSALKLPLHSVQAEMEKYLCAEGGYWVQNDIWRTDSEAYRAGGLRGSRRDGVLADFTECRNANMKLELKYYILCSLKNQWKSPAYVQDVLKSVIRLVGKHVASSGTYRSFAEVGQCIERPLPEDMEPTVAVLYKGFLKGIREFFDDYYDGREETEKDVWHAHKIPGVKISAAMKRQRPSMNFLELPDAYRMSVRRFMKRLVVRRSWSYCKEMLMYIRYFFHVFYERGYADGFLEELSRKDIENYLCWIADDYAGKNATYRSKAVSFIRSWLDYIQIAEYPQAPGQSMERLILDEDVPGRERAADTMEKVRYIPAPVIQQMDACIGQIEPAEMRPVYILLRETGWRGTDVLNLRYDNCLQYIWDGKEECSVPYLCGEITKAGIPQLKDPIRVEVAEMVKLLAEEARKNSTGENNPDRYLFNCYEGRCRGLPYSKAAFSKAVQKMIDKNDIRDADGNLFHFKAHGLRHTRAMEYAEQGMPIGIIQRLLGHCSLQMSLHYAKVTEDTLYQKWKNTERLDLLKPAVLPPRRTIDQEDMVCYEKVRPNLDAVRVPFGVCFKPSKAGCRRQTEQCMECPSFCSTRENLDEYISEIERARSMIRIGETLGREEWVHKNQEYLDRLIRTHDELEKKGIIHKSGSMREA